MFPLYWLIINFNGGYNKLFIYFFIRGSKWLYNRSLQCFPSLIISLFEVWLSSWAISVHLYESLNFILFLKNSKKFIEKNKLFLQDYQRQQPILVIRPLTCLQNRLLDRFPLKLATLGGHRGEHTWNKHPIFTNLSIFSFVF